jgi:LTXXQ motif family protein
MKSSVVVAFLVCIVTASQPAFTSIQRKPSDDEPPHVTTVRASAANAHALADLLATTPVIPRGPRDLLRAYELEMASIAEQLSTDLGAVSNAVGTGQITREQGEYVSGERYQVAMMQFQLLSALHAILEADIARTPAVRTDPIPPPAGEMVLVAMPFSSLQLSPSLVDYLGLTPTQVKAIQKLMDQERPTTEPLMLELRTTSRELGATLQQSQNNEDQGAAQRLAATQARLLKQLMRANSHLQRRINGVLDPMQRRKLDSFKRTSEVTVGEGN